MTSTAAANNLRAVLLCIRSRSGAKIVLNHSCDATAQSNVKASRPGGPKLVRTEHLSNEQPSASPETTLGIKADVLEKLLTPGRWSDRQKFEIAINDLTFVGEPCYAYENGLWTMKLDEHALDEGAHLKEPHATEINEPRSQAQQPRDFTHVAESFGSSLTGHSLATSLESVSTRSGSIADSLLMFNVVFVLQHTQSFKTTLGSTAIYEHLCQPFTKALRYLQEQYYYVELETRKILAAKTKRTTGLEAANTAQTVLHSSELAWAFKVLTDAIAVDGVAVMSLHGMDIALQIPEEGSVLPLQASALHSALLLVEDKHKILHSLDTRPEAAAMSFFITHLVPTKSLSKMASKLALPPSAVLFLAEHLIRWRKARLIAPLHARNTYVVSADAPLDHLQVLAREYSHRFPALPNLQKMLSILGADKPVVYGSCFPSRVHRDAWMDILAWLVRAKLVIRLNTQGWLRLQLTGEDHADGTDNDTVDDNSSTISDSGTAFRPDDGATQPDRLSRILDPSDMTSQERRAVIALRQSLDDGEMQDVFTRLLKYLNGEHAIEDIAALEGFKRSKVDECVSMLNKLEVLQTFQCPPNET